MSRGAPRGRRIDRQPAAWKGYLRVVRGEGTVRAAPPGRPFYTEDYRDAAASPTRSRADGHDDHRPASQQPGQLPGAQPLPLPEVEVPAVADLQHRRLLIDP